MALWKNLHDKGFKIINLVKIILIIAITLSFSGCTQTINPLPHSKQYVKDASSDFVISSGMGLKLIGYKDNPYKVIGTTKVGNTIYNVLLINDINWPTFKLLIDKHGKVFNRAIYNDSLYGHSITTYTLDVVPKDLIFK